MNSHRALLVLLVVTLSAAMADLGPLLATEPFGVGESAPDFDVKAVDGTPLSLKQFSKAKVVVLCFTCNGCPVAKSYEGRFREFAAEFRVQGVEFIAINCDFDEIHGGIAEQLSTQKLEYTYAVDASGQTAKDYGAKVTPQLFVLDQQRKLAYTGPFDDRMNDPTVPLVRNAVEALLGGNTPRVTTKRPFGCRIKLKRR